MEVVPVAAFVNVLVQNLVELSKREFPQIRGLKKEVQKLNLNLLTIQQFLNGAETQTISNEAVKIWLKRLENAAFEADDVLDELHYHAAFPKELKTNIKKKEKVLISCFSPFIDIARNRNMAVSIKEINKDLKSINKMATALGLQKILADAPTMPYAGMETDAFSADPIFIGRDEVVAEIVETLITSVATHDGRVFSILPIVGMGGLGKTTLTRNVFHHQKMETQFGSRIWVHVSQVFDPINLFKKILLELTSSQSGDGEISRQVILKRLQEALKDKTYLLVLDDVWNEDASKWEDFLNSLLGVTTTKGNGIIVTTRNTEVAKIVRPIRIHQLKGLSEEDCWSIIRAKSFGNDGVPSDVESVGREIAKRCGGLPLAASVLGGVLRRDKSVDEWRSISQNWLSSEGEGDNNITKILRLSFNNLSSPSLKKCFSYCSIFPKGERLERQKLIEMWMGEGFLGSNEDMESVGDKFYNVLLHSSLLQVAKKKEYGRFREMCVMHDLVHDMASSVLGFSNNADGITRVRYQLIGYGKREVAQHLRTLIFRANDIYADNIISDFKCLRVLTLDVYSLKELPTSIRKLIHLRNLNITETYIYDLPDWIGELHHLQTLRAEEVWELPSTIKYLINLRHLHVSSIVKLPAEIGRLTSLQTLTAPFQVQDENGHKIEELGSLNNLKGSLTIECLEKVHDKEEAEKANLSKKSKLSELGLEWTFGREDVERINDENVLEGLQPHSNLKKLTILLFKSKRFPLWTMKMAVQNEPQGSWIGLNHLVEIKFDGCTECEEIPMLGHLQNLKSLSFSGLRNVKSINSSFYGIGNETGFVFPALEELLLSHLDSLEEWAEVESCSTSEVKVFPNLQSFNISYCNQLMKVPINHFPSCLKSLKIFDCNQLTTDSYLPLLSKLTSLTDLVLRRLNGLESLPDELFYNNPNFSILQIISCPKLREIPNGLQTLNSLKELIIEECPDLKRIYCSSGGSFTSLAELEIKECHGLMDFPDELFYSNPNLSFLKISGCPKLREIPDGLRTLNYLKKLIIEKCPGLNRIGCSSGGSLTSLAELEIRECHELMDFPNELFYNNPNLSVLKIIGCPRLREIPDGLQTLNYLKKLMIEECPGLKRIGCSSGGSFTSLRKLKIRECHRLVDFPYEMVESTALVLKRVALEGLSSLSNLPRLIECLAKSTARLMELRIVGVPKFLATSVDQVWHFPKLQELKIDVSMEGSRETSVATLDRILQGCSCDSLRWLSLTGMESWECLPESIQHLTSLDKLELRNFGMEEIPEWFNQYISRTESKFKLKLCECKRLRRLPYTHAMQSLIKENRVDIRGCPELQQQSDDGSE